MSKDMYVSYNYNTISHLWLYHKQSYSISKGFLDFIVSFYGYDIQLDTQMHNSNLKGKDLNFLCTFNAPFNVNESFFNVSNPPDLDEDYIWYEESYEVVFSKYFQGFYNNRVDVDEL